MAPCKPMGDYNMLTTQSHFQKKLASYLGQSFLHEHKALKKFIYCTPYAHPQSTIHRLYAVSPFSHTPTHKTCEERWWTDPTFPTELLSHDNSSTHQGWSKSHHN